MPNMGLSDDSVGTSEAGRDEVDGIEQKSIQDHGIEEYAPGSILKIYLVNFLTYECLGLIPGPSLNLVVGPNGSGKSSLVCGIALGLGGRPDLLGRQKTPQEFIKDGCEECTITLGIKNKDGNSSTHITRKIKRVKSNSTWMINGRMSTEKDVKQFVSSVGLQVDNLCTFMPQERVAELAQLLPQDILKEAERSVIGPKPLFEWHKQLCSLGVEKGELLFNLEGQKKILNQNRISILDLEHHIAKLDEKAKLHDQIKKLETRVQWLKYEASRSNYIQAKEERQIKKASLAKLVSRLPSLRKELKDFDTRIGRLENDVKDSQSEVSDLIEGSTGIKTFIAKARDKDRDIKELYMNLCSLRLKGSEREEDIKKLESNMEKANQKIRDLKMELSIPEDVQNPLDYPIEKIEELQKKKDAVNLELAKNTKKICDIKERISKIDAHTQELRDKKGKINEELELIDDIRKQKLDIIRKSDSHCYEATLWIRRNSHIFSNKVSDPILLEISPKDTDYAPIVETSLNRSAFMTFVTNSRSDWHIIHEELILKRNLRISVVDTSNFEDKHFENPLPVKDIKTMGFVGYVSDLIDGPKVVIMALCSMCNLHRQPVALQELNFEQQKKAESGIFTNFFSGATYYTVRCAYKSVSVTAQSIRPLRWLTQKSNSEHKQKLEDEADAIISEIDNCAKDLRSIMLSEAKISQKCADLAKYKDELMESSRELLALKKRLSLYINDLSTYKVQLDCIKLSPIGTEEEENRTLNDISQISVSKAKLIFENASLYERLDGIIAKILEKRITVLDTCIISNKSRSELINLENNIASMESEFAEALNKYSEYKAVAKECLSGFKDKLEMLSRSEKAAIQNFYPDESLDRLESMLREAKARLNALAGASDSSRQKYESLRDEISKGERRIKDSGDRIMDIEKKVAAIKHEWYPALVELVRKINDSFSASLDSIGCAGEVRLVEDDDFGKWKLEILVKFRDEEKLELLTVQRQSGGERSLSTIMFIIALRKASNSPICVVDEINQGMDSKNERAAHSELVKTFCSERSGQTFVVSPKLTTGLEYHHKMKVICVYKVPRSLKQINVKSLIKSRLDSSTKRLKSSA